MRKEQRNHRPNTPDVDCGESSHVLTDLRTVSAFGFWLLQEWMLAKTHRRLAGRRVSESLQQSHKVVIPVKRQSRYKCGSFAYPGSPLIGFLAQIKFCLPVDYEDLCPLWKKHFIFFFFACVFCFSHTTYFQKLLIIIEVRLKVTPRAGSGSGRLTPYLLLADCLALRPGLAWLCQVDGSKRLRSSALAPVRRRSNRFLVHLELQRECRLEP